MPKIVIDARESGTTTGRYIDKLIEYLHKLKPKAEIVILTKPPRLGYFAQVAPDFKVVETWVKEFTFAEQLKLLTQLNAQKAELVHFGMVQQPIFYGGKVVTTMHDLTTVRFRNPAKNPVAFWVKQQVYKGVNWLVPRKSAKIIVPSNYVKLDVANFAHVNPDKIVVTYESADRIKDRPEPIKKLEGTPFIMYIGRPTPHKNLPHLIEAFKQLQATRPGLKLVLAGKKDVLYEQIEQSVQSQGIKDVLFTGFVTEGQLRWMYEHCAAYVFPSLSEGFGLPGLEAMKHGAPVVSSNATCLPEIYGEAAHYFDPSNVEAMALAISDVLDNPDLRTKLIETGKSRAQEFSWEKMAKETIKVYEEVLDINSSGEPG